MSCPMCGSMHGGPCADMITKERYQDLDKMIAQAASIPYQDIAGIASPAGHALHITRGVQDIIMGRIFGKIGGGLQ